MKISVWVLALAALVLLAPPALGLAQKDIVIQPTSLWVTANGAETTSVGVMVQNLTTPYDVEYRLSDSTFGTIVPARIDDTSSMSSQPWFHAGTKSGSVQFIATIYEADGSVTSNETTIYLDHTTPARVRGIYYPAAVQVASPADIAVVMEDRYGNLVENRREVYQGWPAEKTHFIASSIGGEAYFGTPGTVETDRTVIANGSTLVTLTTDTMAGANWVRVEGPGMILPFFITFEGRGGAPVSISQVFVPNDDPWPHIPADGESQFTITYMVQDQYGNPVANQTIRVDTSLGEQTVLNPTDKYGERSYFYGEKSQTGFVNITATVIETPSLQISQIVEFTEMTGVDMQLSVSSITMSSLDVNAATDSQVRARVLDSAGNPVAGEMVQFLIENNEVGTFTQTAPPYLDTQYLQEIWSVTDANGYAIRSFRPGTFAVSGEPGWSPQATGKADIVAIWGTTTGRITLTYKNYPYLRVETEVSNSTLEAGDDLDVTVKLIGDGHMLTRGPVDVVLVPSRSGTMLKQLPDMMMHVYAGEQAFINVLIENTVNGGFDAVGILSSGDDNGAGMTDILDMPSQDRKYAGDDNTRSDDATYVNDHYAANNQMVYDDYTTEELPLTADLPQVQDAIYRTTPYGDVTSGHINPLRRAMHDAVNVLKPGVNPIKAAVILVDNSWSYYGDPLARGNPTMDYTINEGNRYYPFGDCSGMGYGSEQNMGIYAVHNNVRYYIVYVADKENTNDKDALQELAQVTGGNYNYTANPEDLEDIYAWIAEQITKEAAVNASMFLDMVAFENTSITWSAGDIFDYQPRALTSPPFNSTDIHHFTWAGSTNPYWVNAATNPTLRWELEDDTADWYTNAAPDGKMHSLWFDVGTISVKETWQTSFRLKVKDTVTETLQFRLFGLNSIIEFENDPFENLNLFNSSPLITVVPHMTAGPMPVGELDLFDLGVDEGVEFADVTWKVTYTGNFTYAETISYQYQDPRTWTFGPTVVYQVLDPKAPGTDVPGLCRIDITDLSPGTYMIKVEAVAPDDSDSDMTPVYLKGTKSYIIVR